MHLDDTDVFVPGKGSVYGSGLLLDIFRRDWQFWIWALQRSWLYLAIIPLCCAAAFFIFRTVTTPKQYSSSVGMIRQELRSSGAGSMVPTGFNQPQFNVITNMILSRSCLSETLKKLNLDWSVPRLSGAVSVKQSEKNSNYFTINAVTGEPKLSAEIANTLAAVFIEKYTAFISEQVKALQLSSQNASLMLASEINKLYNQLRDLCRENGMTSMSFEAELAMLGSRITAAEERLQAEKNNLNVLTVKINTIKSRLKDIEPQVVLYTESNTSNEQKLVDAKIELDRLRQLYTDENPSVLSQKTLVERLQDKVEETKGEEGSNSRVVMGNNPIYSSLMSDLGTSESEVVLTGNRISDYEKNLEELRQHKRKLEANSSAFTVLELQIEQKKRLISEQEDAIKGYEGFLERSFSDTSIHEAAVPVYTALSRKRFAFGFVGFVLGMLATGGVCLVREALDLSVRSKVDMEKGLTIPVLGVAPRLVPERRSDFYSALQGIVGNLESLMNDVQRPAVLAMAPVKFSDADEKVSTELLNILAVRGLSCLRIMIVDEVDAKKVPHLINDFLYKLSETLPVPSEEGIYYFKLDDMAFMASPTRDVLKEMRERLAEWDIVVWQMFEYNLHPQLFMEICASADLTVFMMEYAKTSKLEVYNILRQIRIAGVRNIVGALFNVDNKLYRRVI
ncbi:MAG: hypothetical protein PHI85_00295 [Victivallaceae bacterium]|nr:hypothetical protein [Victivallaceae bacterium]